MKIQKSFNEDKACLYLVATPIGNLNEMTPRALEVLNAVDVIACEDTRTSSVLLNYFNIKKRLIAYHNFNEAHSAEGILKLLQEGNRIALISDAGYPLLCDPGNTLVRLLVENDYPVIPISGANAALNALVASGLSVHPFLFFGFLNANKSQRVKQLMEHKTYPFTLVYYESPHRIEKTLMDMYEIFGNREICLAREITKKYESFIRFHLSEYQEIKDIKGEIVLIVEGNKEENKIEDVYFELQSLIETGVSKSQAVKEIAKKYRISKNELYEKIHQH